ncbi:MAG TPA: MCE family protein [Acidimicrobiales bacterium]|nr:MCE family protein [Acidimicrobiales bacterium]
MRKFRERNLVIVASVATVILFVGGFFALNFYKFTQASYSADLQSAIGLQPGNVVTIAGVRVGSVTSLDLDGGYARATFEIGSGYHLGSTTSLEVKVLNPVGVEYIELKPSGPGSLHGPIPVERTTMPGTLVGDLNQLTKQTEQTDIPQLVKALQVLTSTVAANSPAQTRAALDGVANLSAVLAADQQQLETLVTQGDQLTGVLNSQSAQIVQLLGQSSVLLQTLEQRKQYLDRLLATTSELTDQIDHVISGDRSVLDPLLTNLQAVSAELAKDSANVSQAIPLLAAFSRYSSNVTGSGPYADFVAPTLVIPDNLIAQCAALAHIDTQRGCRP